VTKVLVRLSRMSYLWGMTRWRTLLVRGLIACLMPPLAAAADSLPGDCPPTSAAMYSRLRTIGLDRSRVFHVRDASIHRPSLDLTLENGTLAFTEDICGKTTGAFFLGDGEVLLQPPNRAERGSLALFTGMAILEEQITSAYLRFNDDTAELLEPFLSPAQEAGDFLKDWEEAAHKLAESDAIRLFLDFSHFLPPTATGERERKLPPLLHVHLLGTKLGTFEVYWDAAIPEPLWAGQTQQNGGADFFNIWTSFLPPSLTGSPAFSRESDVSITSFRIRASVAPPTRLEASADLELHARTGGERTLLFELSRYLKVASVDTAGHPLEFIQNPALEGTQLHRKGNDLVAVVLPANLRAGQELRLTFHYAGEVLSDAGGGLLYVGERGTWYPSFGLNPAQFDLTFHYPVGWTLVATGKQMPANIEHPPRGASAETAGEKVSRWVSERPIPVAGFNLGKYARAEAKAGKVPVEAYGTSTVERSFPSAPSEVVEMPTLPRSARGKSVSPLLVPSPPPSPARDLQEVAQRAADAIGNFSQWFGPYPYSSLAFTQMPGNLSQGWPGLVFLASTAFLSPAEQQNLQITDITRQLNLQVLVHETAHQWWGDLVLWKSYRDQWISEGLANYASLLLLEQKNPAQFRAIMEKYRDDLLKKNKDGEWLRDAGPVTFGQRLVSSHFPNGYDAIAYERGTWLFHMLRSMLRDSEMGSHSRKDRISSDEPFFRALRKARDRYAGKSMSTHDLMEIFQEELPRPLWYENRHNLNWFVDGWVNGTAMPVLSAREVRIVQKAGAASVSGLILQKHVPDDLVTAVPIYAEAENNSLVFLGIVLADGNETSFRISAPPNVRKIVIDPNRTILTAPN